VRTTIILLFLFGAFASGCSVKETLTEPTTVPSIPQPATINRMAPTPDNNNQVKELDEKKANIADPSPAPATPIPAASSYYVNLNNFNIYPVAEGETDKIALLTFDDGPKGKVTLEILDILDKYNAKSVWFVSGFNYGWDYKSDPNKAEQFTTLIKEIDKRGHMIANHTWKHENLRKTPPEEQRKEILSMNELLEEITGKKPQFFRPPYGAYTDVQKQIMKEEGMQTMNWSVGSLDWEHKDPALIVEQVISTMHSGGNILFHDFPVTAKALDPILQELTKQGYKFVLPTEVKME
jgi:peptidoglycan/xylan/chitin deacetylase (PgdA/CDA1 family)